MIITVKHPLSGVVTWELPPEAVEAIEANPLLRDDFAKEAGLMLSAFVANSVACAYALSDKQAADAWDIWTSQFTILSDEIGTQLKKYLTPRRNPGAH